MDKKVVNEIFYRFSEKKPAPKIELEYYSPYTLLIAVVLSAQSTDKGVNKATPHLFALADTPEKMVELGEEQLKKHIKTIGLFNAKAKNIIALSKKLVADYNSIVPTDATELQKLPGVGRKSAHVLLNSLWQKEIIAVDTHVFRVSNRIGLVKAKNVLQTELQLEKVVPKKWKLYAHHWLVLHGRYVCKARKPDCGHCIINDLCKFPEKIF